MYRKNHKHHGQLIKPLGPPIPLVHDHNKKKNVDPCCKHKEIERQVNNPAFDVANFPRITQSETSLGLARFEDFILYGFNDSNEAGNLSGFAFSSNLGNSWTDGGAIPANPTGFNGGDPVIAADRNGVFYYGQIGLEVVAGNPEGVISVSTGTINPNRTITMNLPQVVGRGQIPEPDIGSQDKEWITVGPDADNPGNEALYITWTDFTAPGAGTNIRFSKFTTGVTLTPIIQSQDIVLGGNNLVSGSFVVVDNRGIIYVFYEQVASGGFNVLGQPNRSIRMAKSIDGGNTFPINLPVSLPFAAAATTTVPCNRPSIGVDNSRQIRMNEFPHAALGPDGTIYVVWNAGVVVGNTTFIDTFLAYSQDEGNSWNQLRITNNPAFSFFPSVAVNCKGAHIQYNRFNDPNGSGGVGDGTFGVFMKTFSLSAGLSGERMVSNRFSPLPITNPNQDPALANCYMGDYNQIIAGPGSCLLHAYGDNRNTLNGLNNPDVFFKLTVPKKIDPCSCQHKKCDCDIH
jgi:hypothetical protein